MKQKNVLGIIATIVSVALIMIIILSVVNTEFLKEKNLSGNGSKDVKMSPGGAKANLKLVVLDTNEDPDDIVTVMAPGTAWFRLAPNLYERLDAANNYTWKPSKANGEYYLTKVGGGDPGIDNWEIEAVYQTTQGMEPGIVGALVLNSAIKIGQWGIGDNDNLGFNTIYVKYETTLPFVITASRINPDFSWGSATTDNPITNDIRWTVTGPSDASNQPERQGFNSAFFFETPGTYNVNLQVINSEGNTVTATRQVNVLNNTRTQIYISGSPEASDTTGDGTIGKPYRTLFGAIAKSGGKNVNYNLERGYVYSETKNIRPMGENTVISSYGNQTSAKPFLNFAYSFAFQFGAKNQLLKDITINSSVGVLVYMDGEQRTINNVDFIGVYSYAMTSNDLHFGAVMNISAPVISSAYKIWFGGNNVLPGNPYKNLVVYDSEFGGAMNEVVTRGGSDYIVFQNNRFIQQPNVKGTIREMYGNYWWIEGNSLDDGSIALQIPAGQGGARTTNIVIANNKFFNANVGGGSNKVTMNNIMIRGNIFDIQNYTLGAIPRTVIGFGRNKPSNITVAYNTYYHAGPQPVFISIDLVEANNTPWLSLISNLGVAPNAIDNIGDSTYAHSFGKIIGGNSEGNDTFIALKDTVSWSPEPRTGYLELSSRGGNGAGDGLGITALGGSGWATYSWNYINKLAYGSGNKELKNVSLNSNYEVVEGDVAIGSYVPGVHTDFYGNKIRPGDTGLKVGAVQKATRELPKNPVCGNNIKESGEQCDDGNNINGDGCSSICKIEVAQPVCGNGIKELGEECDDGNNVNNDACSNQCTINIVKQKNNKTLDFDGKRTTNITNESNLSKVGNFKLEREGKGEIAFIKEIDFRKYNLNKQLEEIIQKINDYISIYEKTIIIDSQNLLELNQSATLTMYNLTETKPRILMDGQTCPADVCQVISYVNGTLIFNVTHFTNYTIIEEPITPTPSNPSGGSGGGSGGGGGSTTSNTKNKTNMTTNTGTGTTNNKNLGSEQEEVVNNNEGIQNEEETPKINNYSKTIMIVLGALAIILLTTIIVIIRKRSVGEKRIEEILKEKL